MTKISERKTRLSFETDAEMRGWGSITVDKEKKKTRRVPVTRAIIVDVDNGFVGSVRLKGTNQRFEFSWHGLYDWAAEIHARREKDRRKKERAERRKFHKDGSRF